jgi:hypothetical protein
VIVRKCSKFSQTERHRTHLWPYPRFPHPDWADPGSFLRSRSPRAEKRKVDLATRRPDRARWAMVSGLRPRQFQLGAQCPCSRRSCTRPRPAAPSLRRTRELPAELRPPFLKEYLDRFATEVQRFFPVPKGSAVEAFNDLAPRYPVFELQPLSETSRCAGALTP